MYNGSNESLSQAAFGGGEKRTSTIPSKHYLRVTRKLNDLSDYFQMTRNDGACQRGSLTTVLHT